MRNSIDAVSDRDFALDYLYAAAMLFQHLSRMGEEIVLWSTSEFGFVKLPENASTGSSMMPQKLNPDVAELVRGKAGTAIGRLTGLLATVKGLPLAYDRDLQEDKAPVFDARRDVRLALQGMTVLVSGLEANRERLAEAVADPLLLATDVAEELVKGRGPVPGGARAGRRLGARRLLPPDGDGGGERRRAAPGPATSSRRSRRRAGASAPATTRDGGPLVADARRPSAHPALPRRTSGGNRPRRTSTHETNRTRGGPRARRRRARGRPAPRGRERRRPRAPATDTVTVTGTGGVTAVPDRAQISAGVESRARPARARSRRNATAMQKVLAALEARGGQGRHDADRLALDRVRREGPAERLRRHERRLGRDDARRRGRADRRRGRRGREHDLRPVALALRRGRALSPGAREGRRDAKDRAALLAKAAGRELGRVTAIIESVRRTGDRSPRRPRRATPPRPSSRGPRRRPRR